ncbi:hypothetical protein GGI43DRAFT_312383 [Trichoderma evansii]
MLRRLLGPFPGPSRSTLARCPALLDCLPPKFTSTGCLELSLRLFSFSLPHLPFQLPAGMHVTSPFCLGKSGYGNTAVVLCSTLGIIAIIAPRPPIMLLYPPSPSFFLLLSSVPCICLFLQVSISIHCLVSYLWGAVNGCFSSTQLAHLVRITTMPRAPPYRICHPQIT